MSQLTEADEQAIIMKFKQLVEERQALGAAVIDREHELEEHNVVIKSLEQQDGAKRAWRLVGDVLVERTVAEMRPEVAKNRDNLIAVRENFKKQLEAKSKETQAFQEKYKIRIKDENNGGGSGAAQEASGSSAQGVLVSS